jgi:hypothetical protein
LDRTGLIGKIFDSAVTIDRGRKLLNTEGLADKGRIDYDYGLALAMETFQAVYPLADTDLQTLMLAE